mmetsp:Transcript_20039/g.32269  ORF Transcript_20039/g.32269 Transcript_20039/m.32269 type:complete len:192 (-) Transcript_20039:154-729(-)|eukprot:CAMPEP_0171530746 /NCGR_PEP_ID=MMETSP0959-20130129/13341_1 /TAXON_ID=87120 /ORGANISM="Aurantiochytrium limacinum, Strain ATCCMYA-1381" /LENGTH=191 /DNA_ID=CAMNT_0012073757 /DNA_START=141 /DNA_END=716 /DNA_ORIENTATION=-
MFKAIKSFVTTQPAKMNSVYEASLKTLEGEPLDFSTLKGKVLVLVNVAGKCGLTKGEYTGLQKLHDSYAKDGLVIVGFPCNQFAGQEPGDAAEIREFVSTQFDPPIAFTLTEKIEVNGDDAHPLWTYLKNVGKSDSMVPLAMIKWNFTKFLVNRDGSVIERFEPKTPALTMENRIKEMLAEPAPTGTESSL